MSFSTNSQAELKPQGRSDLSQVISTASVEHKPSMSLRANFSATFVGNAVFAASQWAILILIAKLGSNVMLGQYALALAIVTPVMQFSHLNLQAVLATDIAEKHPFGDYLAVRLGTIVLGLAVVCGITLVSRCAWPVPAAVLFLGAALSVDNLSSIFFGLLQRRERMDLIAWSMIARGLISVAALGVTLWLTHSLLAAVGALAAVRTTVLLVYDRPIASVSRPLRTSGLRAQVKVFWTSLPLGIVLMLVALAFNFPRYAIEQKLGTATLGSFAAVASFMTAGSTIVNALGQSALPRLARYFTARDLRRFQRLTWQLAGLTCLLGAAGVVAACLLGRPLLGILYRPAYEAYARLLAWIMVAGLLSYVSSILGYVITSARVFIAQMPVLATAAGSSAIVSWTLIPRMGLDGAAVTLGTMALVTIIGQLVILRRVFSKLDSCSVHRKSSILADGLAPVPSQRVWKT